MTDYDRGWHDAFNIIANYVEKEICIVTSEMIRRMEKELWRYQPSRNKEDASSEQEQKIEE